MMDGRSEIRFGGFGGQGIVLAGTLLGRAACLHDGRDAVLTQAYGPEARGGASNTDVIIANSRIDYPFVTHPDALVLLFQEACNRFQSMIRPGGLVIVEADLVTPAAGGDARIVTIPATRMAETIGNPIVMNVIMLGCLVGLTGIVSRAALEEALVSTIRPGSLALDQQALAAGFTFAEELDEVAHA